MELVVRKSWKTDERRNIYIINKKNSSDCSKIGRKTTRKIDFELGITKKKKQGQTSSYTDSGSRGRFEVNGELKLKQSHQDKKNLR